MFLRMICRSALPGKCFLPILARLLMQARPELRDVAFMFFA